MNDLKIIENDLVPVYETDKGEKVVYGKDLHKSLEVKTDFSTWVKRRLAECDAEENKDFDLLPIFGENPLGGRPQLDYVVRLDTAKEMAMLERNEKGKQVRKYFIAIEEKYKQNVVDRSQLSPQMQMFYAIADGQAKVELEQKRQAEQLNRIEQRQEAIADTFQRVDDAENFQKWASACIAKIAESPNFNKGTSRSMKYSCAWSESYERLMKKRNCRLDDRVQRAIGRALEERPDIKKSELQKINKLYVIANDKDLKPAYELVIKEMMICYCVKSA